MTEAYLKLKANCLNFSVKIKNKIGFFLLCFLFIFPLFGFTANANPINSIMDKISIFSGEEGGANVEAARNYARALSSLTEIGPDMAAILGAGGGGSNGVLSAITNVMKAFNRLMMNGQSMVMPIGYAICLLFFIMSLFQLAMEDRMSPEILMKHFAKCGLSLALIGVCGRLTQAFISFGNGITSMASSLTGASGSAKTMQGLIDKFKPLIQAEIESADGPNPVSVVMLSFTSGMVMDLIGRALRVVCYTIAMTRAIEMSLRGMGMPIAIGMMSDDGWRGAGGRYIRKFIAVCAQGFALLVISGVATTAMATVIDTAVTSGGGDFASKVWSAMLVMSSICLASIKAMHSSQQIMNDMFGA